MKTVLVIALLLAPARAFASCESSLVVNSRELAFVYSDPTTLDTAPLSPSATRAHHRGLAHALAVAQACLDSARTHRAGSRSEIRMDPGTRADVDSTCVLWTCELGRYRTEAGARSRWENASVLSDLAVHEKQWVPSRDATLLYESCAGSWEPGAFIVRLPGATVAPWSARCGLYFTSADAEKEAANWERVLQKPIRVVRQRVDGRVLEEALREPIEGC